MGKADTNIQSMVVCLVCWKSFYQPVTCLVSFFLTAHTLFVCDQTSGSCVLARNLPMEVIKIVFSMSCRTLRISYFTVCSGSCLNYVLCQVRDIDLTSSSK